jgi:hypothetical protein
MSNEKMPWLDGRGILVSGWQAEPRSKCLANGTELLFRT